MHIVALNRKKNIFSCKDHTTIYTQSQTDCIKIHLISSSLSVTLDYLQYSWRSDSMFSEFDESVFSLAGEGQDNPATSWNSSNYSLYRQDTDKSSAFLHPNHHTPLTATNSLQPMKIARSNSTTDRSSSNQLRLTVPGTH